MTSTTKRKAATEIYDSGELRRELRGATGPENRERRRELNARSKELLQRPEEMERMERARLWRQQRDDKYLEWCDRYDQATQDMRQADLWPYSGGVEQPVFWQGGKVAENGAVRLDFYDSRHELQTLQNTARAFQAQGNYELPEAFLLQAAQFFYSGGQLCEVRLSGYNMTPRRDQDGRLMFDFWETPIAPQVQADEDSITLTPDPVRRPQIAVLNETVDEALTLERDFHARLSQGDAPPPKDILRLLIAWNFSTQEPDDANNPNRREVTHATQLTPIVRGANDSASKSFARMIMRLEEWDTNENGPFKFAQDGAATVIYKPEEEIPDLWSDFRERVLQALDRRFTAMRGALVADIADILFWHWLSSGRPAFANITLGQILEYRDKKVRDNLVEEHWNAMRDLRAIQLRGEGIECEKMFHISAAQPNLWHTAEPPKVDTLYRYHPGYFLSEAIQSDAFFLTYYAREVWALDYYRDAGAKKLARVLRADWRGNAANYLPSSHPLAKAPRFRTWRALLEEAGIDFESGTAVAEPKQFIKNVERDLEKLYDISFVRECGAAIYHPDDLDKYLNLPRRGALPIWLALRTHIAPDAATTDALTGTAARRLARAEQQRALTEGKRPGKGSKKRNGA